MFYCDPYKAKRQSARPRHVERGFDGVLFGQDNTDVFRRDASRQQAIAQAFGYAFGPQWAKTASSI